MAAPRIQFFKGDRGRRLAYAIAGDGPLLVLPPWWVSHLERDFEEPRFADLFARLAERFTVVRYDRAGVGLSDRDRADFDLEGEVRDLGALIDTLDALGKREAALLCVSCAAPPALAYAARRPERVSRLILYGAYADGSKLVAADVQQALVALVRAHWGLGSRTIGDMFAPGLQPDEANRFSAMQREAASAETAASLLDLSFRMDASAFVSQVRAPTLVLHRKKDRTIAIEHGRDVASRVPNATLVTLEGKSHIPWYGDVGPFLDAVFEFLACGPQFLGVRAPAAAAIGDARAPVAASDAPAITAPPAPTVHVAPNAPAAHNGAPPNTFACRGDVWSLAFAGRRAHLKHARGLGDLATLLAHPGTELHVSVLARGATNSVGSNGDGVDGTVGGGAGADPVLDGKALAQARARVRELDDEIGAAEARGEHARATAADRERDALTAELRRATGLNGRSRKLADPDERARKAVTARIRDSIEKIRSSLPELARHFDESVVTGTFCVYAPKQAVAWRFAPPDR